jgi:hypothetical protein
MIKIMCNLVVAPVSLKRTYILAVKSRVFVLDMAFASTKSGERDGWIAVTLALYLSNRLVNMSEETQGLRSSIRSKRMCTLARKGGQNQVKAGGGKKHSSLSTAQSRERENKHAWIA